MSWFDEIARWYLVTLIAGIAVAPLVAWLFRRLPGHGAFFARPVGLIAVVWPAWFLASISPVPYSNLALVVSTIAVAAVCWGMAWRQGAISRDWVRSWLAAEVVFLASFLTYLWFKGYVPKIAGTEKPMDEAFLSATIRATDMPPADPWMAGETINYYYLGYLLNGSVARIAGLPGWVAFSLALASTFAMSASAAAGLAWGAIRSTFGRRAAVAAGSFAAFLVMIAGNMRGPIAVLRDFDATWNGFWWNNDLGWESSRVIVDTGGSLGGETIQEFPSFSFVLGDLHPHVLTLPFTIVALALAVSLFRRVHAWWDPFQWRCWTEFAAVGVFLGALYPLNSWDFPTYGLAIAVALLVATGLNYDWLQQIGAVAVVAILAWSPFWLTFVPFSGTGSGDVVSIPGLRFVQKNLGLFTGERTSASEYLTVWGLTWTVAVTFLVVETIATWPPGGAEADPATQPSWMRGVVLASVLAFILIAIALPAHVLILAGIPTALAVWLIMLRISGPRDLTMLVCVLYAAGWGITILTEFFYIRDVFNGRFNTLFKIYYQVWTLVGIASALAIVLLWQRASLDAGRRALMTAALAVAVAAGLVYPVVSVKTWIDYQNPAETWLGLDGLAPHGTEAFVRDPANPVGNTGKSRDDVAAIRWLNDNALPGDVVLEAPGCGYQLNGELPTGRFSAFTGFPTVIGWDNSENQWRAGQPELLRQVSERAGDVGAMFENPDPVNNPLFDQYDITLLVIGDFERYGAGEACEKAGPYQSITVPDYPGSGWTLVYDGGTRIYRRTQP